MSEEEQRTEEEMETAEREEAPTEEISEPTLAQLVAEVIRERSRTRAVLTPVDSLRMDGVEMPQELRDQLVQDIQAEEGLKDIQLMRSETGRVYLYSSEFISDTYARILFRAEEGNPYEIIAATVREESEVYPRPTPVESFKNPTFGLDPDKVEETARELTRLPRYEDIKTLEASTGALYLYSDRHLERDWAESLMEWEEVGRYNSP